MPIDPITLSLLASGGGILGGLLSRNNDSGISNALMRQLYQQAREGVGVNEIVAPQLGAIASAAAQAQREQNIALGRSGLSNTSIATAVPGQIMAERGKQTGQAYTEARAENERSKERARAMLMQLLGQRYDQSSGDLWGQLTGAGIGGLLQGLYNTGNINTGLQGATIGGEPGSLQTSWREYAKKYEPWRVG